jgi:hypothetical protein
VLRISHTCIAHFRRLQGTQGRQGVGWSIVFMAFDIRKNRFNTGAALRAIQGRFLEVIFFFAKVDIFSIIELILILAIFRKLF